MSALVEVEKSVPWCKKAKVVQGFPNSDIIMGVTPSFTLVITPPCQIEMVEPKNTEITLSCIAFDLILTNRQEHIILGRLSNSALSHTNTVYQVT